MLIYQTMNRSENYQHLADKNIFETNVILPLLLYIFFLIFIKRAQKYFQ